MKIIGVSKNSIAEELNITPKDELIAFNGKNVVDVLDYEFFAAKNSFVMTIKSGDELIDFEIEKDDDEDMGLELEESLTPITCHNKCMFCFVDQLPNDSLRKTLYVKDDDYRHSFISGNYITMTNITKVEMERIKKLRLSPLYISVHSTNDELRKKMLGIKNAPSVMTQIKELSDEGIEIHTQIVYCPEVNEDYAKSAKQLFPFVKTLAIVPVGLTKNCNKSLKKVDRAAANAVIDSVEKLQKEFFNERGSRFVFLADEFYQIAEREFPPIDQYEELLQIDNGVGMVALFLSEFNEAVNLASGKAVSCSLATGQSAYPIISKAAKEISNKFGGEINVYRVENNFFGKSVTVAGLVTGSDIYAALKDKQLNNTLIIPRCMLKRFNNVFLDDMTVNELEEKLNVKIKVIETDGYSFVKAFGLKVDD